MEVLGLTGPDIAGIAFLAGLVIFAIGVSIPERAGMDRSVFGTAATHRFLEIIGANPRAWRNSAAWLGSGTLVNALGIGVFTLLLSEGGSQVLAIAALITFLSGALLMILAMGFRMAVDLSAADTLAKTAQVPSWFEAMGALNTTLVMIYLALGYAATAMIGGAIVQSDLLAGWIGWLSLALGLGGALSILTSQPHYPGTEFSIAAVPLWLHIAPLIYGVALLLA